MVTPQERARRAQALMLQGTLDPVLQADRLAALVTAEITDAVQAERQCIRDMAQRWVQEYRKAMFRASAAAAPSMVNAVAALEVLVQWIDEGRDPTGEPRTETFFPEGVQ